jgi:hypothetical protein
MRTYLGFFRLARFQPAEDMLFIGQAIGTGLDSHCLGAPDRDKAIFTTCFSDP